VEAPAGCGKTRQGADYAREITGGGEPHRLLILTHTHAACSVFSERTGGCGRRVEIRTIDSIIAQIASAYHAGLGIPADTAVWVRQRDEGHAELAVMVATLLECYPMIAASVARRYPVVICDEHQDSTGDQHCVIMGLSDQGARLRIFADPMQNIFSGKALDGARPPYSWSQLTSQAQAFEQLEIPHRWLRGGCPDLGRWTLAARSALQIGGKIDLRGGLPRSIGIVFAENHAAANLEYQLSGHDRKPIDAFERAQSSLLILTRYNQTARSFRGFFNRRVPLWEGHTRSGLENLVDALAAGQGDCGAVAASIVAFMSVVGKGFSPSAFGDRFEQEARDGCTAMRRGKPATIQELARFVMAEPDYRGVSKMLRRLSELKEIDDNFASIEMDCHREFWEAVRLGDFNTAEEGLAEITHRRTYSRPKPPDRAISTIHKAKGLECNSVIIMPCDSRTFPDKPEARCLLYVALSRAKNRLMLVISRKNPSPLFII
jgi:DNA helicase-2/ATP-dependent DNA helicase PcrA